MGFRGRETDIMRQIKGAPFKEASFKDILKGGKKAEAPNKPKEVEVEQIESTVDPVDDMDSSTIVQPLQPSYSAADGFGKLITDLDSSARASYKAVNPNMTPYLDTIKDAQDKMTKDLSVLGDNLVAAKERAKTGRASQEEKLQWAQLGEKAAQALTQFAAGLYGLQKGVDMSGLKFEPSDWAEKFKAARTDYLDELGQLATQYGYDSEAVKLRKGDTIESAKLGMGVEADKAAEAQRVAKYRADQANATADAKLDLQVKQIQSKESEDKLTRELESRERLANIGAGVKDKLRKNSEAKKSFDKGITQLNGATSAVGGRESNWNGSKNKGIRMSAGEGISKILISAGLNNPAKVNKFLQAAGIPPREKWFGKDQPITAEMLTELSYDEFRNVSVALQSLSPAVAAEDATPAKPLTSASKSDTITTPGSDRKVLPSARDLP